MTRYSLNNSPNAKIRSTAKISYEIARLYDKYLTRWFNYPGTHDDHGFEQQLLDLLKTISPNCDGFKFQWLDSPFERTLLINRNDIHFEKVNNHPAFRWLFGTPTFVSSNYIMEDGLKALLTELNLCSDRVNRLTQKVNCDNLLANMIINHGLTHPHTMMVSQPVKDDLLGLSLVYYTSLLRILNENGISEGQAVVYHDEFWRSFGGTDLIARLLSAKFIGTEIILPDATDPIINRIRQQCQWKADYLDLANEVSEVFEYEGTIYITRKWDKINFQDNGFIGSDSEPAVLFRNGHAIYTVNQLDLRSQENLDLFNNPTREWINSQVNMDIKRIAINRYGISKWIQESDESKIVDVVVAPNGTIESLVRILNYPKNDHSMTEFRQFLIAVDPAQYKEGDSGVVVLEIAFYSNQIELGESLTHTFRLDFLRGTRHNLEQFEEMIEDGAIARSALSTLFNGSIKTTVINTVAEAQKWLKADYLALDYLSPDERQQISSFPTLRT